MVVHTLVFAGGGTRGLCYGKAYQELHRHEQIDLQKVKGTSIGALMAVLLAAKYTAEELVDLCRATKLEDMVRINLFDVFYRWGLDSGKRLYDWIDEKLYEKTGKRHTTFSQLYDHSGIDLHVTSTNLCTAEACYMSNATHPIMPVAKACQMSMSLPPLFAPVYWNGAYHIDGGVMDNFPFQECEPLTTIGFRINWNNAFELNSMEKYFSRVVYVALYRLSKVAMEHASEEWKERIIEVDGGDVATINMRVTQAVREALNEKAVEAVQRWLEKNS